MTDTEAILRYLRAQYPAFKRSHELMARELIWSDTSGDHREWVGSEGKKRCRELVTAGLIDRGPNEGKVATFRAKPPTTYETGIDPKTGEVLYRRPVYQ